MSRTNADAPVSLIAQAQTWKRVSFSVYAAPSAHFRTRPKTGAVGGKGYAITLTSLGTRSFSHAANRCNASSFHAPPFKLASDIFSLI